MSVPVLLRFAQGLLMGLGCILPGVSGGVMAVSFGLYGPMLDTLTGFFHDWKGSLRFLLPLTAGIALGALAGAAGLKLLLEQYRTPLLYLFIGLILGGVPGMLREANADGFRLRWLWALAGGIAAASLLLLLETGARDGAGAAALSPIEAVAAGAIVAVGTIVPGISTSFLLIYLGWYQAMLAAFAAMNVEPLLWLAAGAVLCALLTIRLMRTLLNRWRGPSYYATLGVLLVSAALVFPGLESGWAMAADTALLLAGLAAGWLLGRAKQGGDAAA